MTLLTSITQADRHS